MFRSTLLASVLALLSLSACDTNILSAERDTTVSAVGTVREIDPANRRFVVRADGQVLTLRATDTLRNFDQLEVGDRIRVEYEESVAVGMALPGDTGQPEAIAAGAAAPEGAKPGAAGFEAVSVVVDFIAYDQRAKTATIRTQEGDILRVAVPSEMRKFAKARQPGDRIVVDFERAVAIFVEPAA
ncbi:MAG: hypothetical protein ACK5MY_17995 [Jhaorihella sp.]